MQVHERFVAGTTTLHDYIIELGFTMVGEEGHGSKKRKTYEKGNRVIIDAYDWVDLAIELPSKKPDKQYRGYTISKDLLTFFAQRTPMEVKNETDL